MTGEYQPYELYKGKETSQALIVEYLNAENKTNWLQFYWYQIKSREVSTIADNSIMLNIETSTIRASLNLRNFTTDSYKTFADYLLTEKIKTIFHYPSNPQKTEQQVITVSSVQKANPTY